MILTIFIHIDLSKILLIVGEINFLIKLLLLYIQIVSTCNNENFYTCVNFSILFIDIFLFYLKNGITFICNIHQKNIYIYVYVMVYKNSNGISLFFFFFSYSKNEFRILRSKKKFNLHIVA